MKSKRNIVIFAILISFLLTGHVAQAADLAQNSAVFTGNDSTVSFVIPVRFESMTIAPKLTYYSEYNNDKFSTERANSYHSGYEILAGLYLHKGFSDSVEGHYGGRVGFGQSQYEDTDDFNNKIETSADSVILNPTLGLQYMVNKNLSLGLDAGLRLEQSTSTTKTVSNNGTITYSDETDDFKTTMETRLVVRAFF